MLCANRSVVVLFRFLAGDLVGIFRICLPVASETQRWVVFIRRFSDRFRLFPITVGIRFRAGLWLFGITVHGAKYSRRDNESIF